MIKYCHGQYDTVSVVYVKCGQTHKNGKITSMEMHTATP